MILQMIPESMAAFRLKDFQSCSLLCFFEKYFVKAIVLQNKILTSLFHKIFFLSERNPRFFTVRAYSCILKMEYNWMSHTTFHYFCYMTVQLQMFQLQTFHTGCFTPKTFHPQDFSPPRPFTPKTFHPQDFSPPRPFSPKFFHPQTFHPQDVSPPRLFTPKSFHPQDFSSPRLFTPKTFQPQMFQLLLFLNENMKFQVN